MAERFSRHQASAQRVEMGDLIGHSATLRIRRFGPPGAFLAVDENDTRPNAEVVLLLGPEVPPNAKEGDAVDVFVALDSEGRPLATTRRPALELGDVAFLTIRDVTKIGAFADWGLPKELLVPFAEQTTEMRVGERYAIGLYIDDTGRLAGTMRVSEMLRDQGEFELDEWVEGEAWRKDPQIGVFVIIERAFVGLLPAGEPNNLARGDQARFRVSNILPDGKIELSLRGHAHEELENDAKKILAVLGRPDSPRIGDRSDPEQIREVFGLSKKAFKRAAGRLLKDGSATIDREGFLVLRQARARAPK